MGSSAAPHFSIKRKKAQMGQGRRDDGQLTAKQRRGAQEGKRGAAGCWVNKIGRPSPATTLSAPPILGVGWG